MAARKSCTHLTWADAKASVGGDSGIKKKKGEKPKKLSHVEKIIAKNGQTKEDQALARSFQKQERRQEEKLAAIAEKRAQERQRQLEIPKVKPSEQARRKIAEMAAKLAAEAGRQTLIELPSTGDMHLAELKAIAHSKEIQLSEIFALEAIYADTDEFRVCDASQVDQLQEALENYQMDEENEDFLRSVVGHAPQTILLQLNINDEDQRIGDGEVELVVSVLLRATLPPTYPIGDSTSTPGKSSSPLASNPLFGIEYFCCTDRNEIVNADKPLETMAHLDEAKLLEYLQMKVLEILPDPCIYEVVTSLSENIFDFLDLSATHRAQVQ
jgi:hypothetical protein